MERFYSLMREKENVKKKIKLKIDPTKEIHLQMRAIANYIYETGEWSQLDVELSVLDAIRSVGDKISKGEMSLYYLTDKDEEWVNKTEYKGWEGYRVESFSQEENRNLTTDTTYFMFNSDAKKTVSNIRVARAHFVREPSVRFYIGNYHYQLGYMVLNQDLMNYYDENIQEFESHEISKDEFVKYIDGLRNLPNKKRYEKNGSLKEIFIYPSYVKEKDKRDFMYDQVVNYIQSAYDAVRQREYAKRIQQDLKAEVYETKKHIKVSTQKVMDNTPLLKYFKYVEIDNEVDLNKYQKFEKELNTLLPNLPQAESQAELRLRKLGRHKALGLFVPDFNTIVVDFRSSKDTHVVGGVGIQSFIHEYGHYLDFNFDKGNLSLSPAFQPIVKDYQKELNKEAYKEFFDMKGKDGKYDLDYYTIPTEVFARAFELYTHEIGLRSNLMHTDMLYRSSVPYKAFTPENRERITQYFDQQFPDYRQKIQDLVINNEIDKVNTKSERPKEEQRYLLSYGRNYILLTDAELENFGEKAVLKTVRIDDKSYEVITAKEKSWEKIQKLVKTYATPERTFTRDNLQSQAQEMLIVMPNDFSKEGILLSEKNRQEENIQLVASRRTKLLGNHLQAIFVPANDISMQKVMEKLQDNEQIVQLSPVNKAPVQFKPVAQKMQEQESDFERE